MNTLSHQYEQDFPGWVKQHIALLQAGKFQELDVEHLIEELEGMATRDKNELVSHLVILIAHLLKWQYQFKKFAESWQHADEYAAKSWQYTIIEQRYRLHEQLENHPSLQSYLNEAVAKAYPKAVTLAVDETGLPRKTFPLTCSYSLEQVLNKTFYPVAK
jgi:hypothetical protein